MAFEPPPATRRIVPPHRSRHCL